MKKRFFAAITAVLLILSFASCAGIGDGALMRNEGSEVPDKTYIDESMFIPDIGIEIPPIFECEIIHYDLNRTLMHKLTCSGTALDQLKEILENSIYLSGSIDMTDLRTRDCFEIVFNGDVTQTYTVYSHDAVYLATRGADGLKNTIMGTSTGIYDNLTKLLGVFPSTAEGTAEPINYSEIICEIAEMSVLSSSIPASVIIEGEQASRLYAKVTDSLYSLTGDEIIYGSGSSYSLVFKYADGFDGDERFNGEYHYTVMSDDSVFCYSKSRGESYVLGKIDGIYNSISVLIDIQG